MLFSVTSQLKMNWRSNSWPTKKGCDDGARLRYGDYQRRGALLWYAVRRGNIGIVGASGTGSQERASVSMNLAAAFRN